MADAGIMLTRLSEIECALHAALDAGDADRLPALARERDVLLKALAPTLDPAGLQALVDQDAAFVRAMAARRAAAAAELETLRTGRRAARAYGETAGC